MNIFRASAVFGFLALALIAPGCSSTGFDDIDVSTEADTEVDFDGYKSYAWSAAAAVIRDPEGEWQVPELDIGAEIMHLVNSELRGMGMTEVATAPDLHVIYAVGIDMKALKLVYNEEAEGDLVEEVPEGGVVILMTDPKTREVVWAASAKAELQAEPELELAKQRLAYAISEMFADFPN